MSQRLTNTVEFIKKKDFNFAHFDDKKNHEKSAWMNKN